MSPTPRTLFALGTVGLLLAVGLLAIAGSGAAARPSAKIVQPLYVDMTIAGGGNIYVMSPPTIVVPPGTLITFRIVNMDPRIGLMSTPVDNHVWGTVGGRELVMTSTGALWTSALPPRLSHTFTVVAAMVHLNAPIPPADPHGVPTIIVFSVVFPYAGSFAWSSTVQYPAQGGPPMTGLLMVTV